MKYKIANPEFKKLRGLMESKKVPEQLVFEALKTNKDDFEHILRGKVSITEADLNALVPILGDEVRHIFVGETNE